MSGTEVGGPSSEKDMIAAQLEREAALSDKDRAARLQGHGRMIAERRIREAETKRIFKSHRTR